MKRIHTRSLPAITVEEKTVSVRVEMPADLDNEIGQYARYFAQASGRKPLTRSHVIVGLLARYLADSEGFQQWKQEHRESADLNESAFAVQLPGRSSTHQKA